MASKISSQTNQIRTEPVDPTWKGLYKAGGMVGIVLFVLTIAQSVVFLVWPPPETVEEYFNLFQNNWLRGLLSMDLIYIAINILLIIVYLTLYAALKRVNKAATTSALVIGLVGIAAYFASNTAFEMLSLSHQYFAATTDLQRSIYLGAGESLLATYGGTAFDVYYILNAVTLIIFSVVMLRSRVFNKITAYLGLIAGILMLIPSTAGTIGLYFSLFSIIPWAIWLIPFARRTFQLEQSLTNPEENQS